jgi:hypothetical protein
MTFYHRKNEIMEDKLHSTNMEVRVSSIFPLRFRFSFGASAHVEKLPDFLVADEGSAHDSDICVTLPNGISLKKTT